MSTPSPTRSERDDDGFAGRRRDELPPVSSLLRRVQRLVSGRLPSVTRATADTHPRLVGLAAAVATETGVATPRVYVVESAEADAVASGLTRRRAVICVTTALLDRLSTPELEAILAHELAHVRRRHVPALLGVALAAFLAALVSLAVFGGPPLRSALLPWGGGYLAICAAARRQEFAADRGAVDATGNASALVSALDRIGRDAESRVPRLASRLRKHPPMDDRIDAIRSRDG